MADRPQSVLRCPICGGAQPATDQIENEGWFECRFCGEFAAIPGAGTFVTAAPGHRVTEVIRPGRRTIAISGEPANHAKALALLLSLDILGAIGLTIVREAAPAFLWWVGVPLYVGIFLLAYSRRGHASGARYLHIEDSGAVTLQQETPHGPVEIANTTLAWLRAKKEPELGTAFEGPGIVLHRSDREIARVPFASRADRDWVFPRLRTAARVTTQVDLTEGLRCDGCGGGLGPRVGLAGSGSLDCPHCKTGLVYVHGGVHLPPFVLECPSSIGAAMPTLPPSAAERPVTITLPRTKSPQTYFFWGVLILVSVALVPWTGPWLLSRLPYFPILSTFGIVLTLAPAVFAGRDIFEHGIARSEFHLTDTSLEYRKHFGSRVLRRDRFPVFRLLRVEAAVEPGKAILTVCTSTRETRLELPLQEPKTLHALGRLLAHLGVRAERLGRLGEAIADDTWDAAEDATSSRCV